MQPFRSNRPEDRHPATTAGNPPPERSKRHSGLLNSIGLDNDGIDYFLANHVPYLTSLGTAVIANIADYNRDEFVENGASSMTSRNWRRSG
ncbi:MAG: hypothetical protein R2724_34025 [Bryobacterales bacterium]